MDAGNQAFLSKGQGTELKLREKHVSKLSVTSKEFVIDSSWNFDTISLILPNRLDTDVEWFVSTTFIKKDQRADWEIQ